MNMEEPILETHETLDESYVRNSSASMHTFIKIIVLLFVSLVYAGPNFCYENFVPLQNAMVEHMKLSELQYNSLTSFYSIPNIIFVVFSGLTVDNFGYQLCTSIFCLFCFLGQLIFCLAVYNKNYFMMISGRLIYGFGTESLQIAVNKYIVNWFFGSSLTISFSLVMSISRISSFLNVFFSLKIYEYLSKLFSNYDSLLILSSVFAISVIITFISLFMSIVLWMIDSRWHHIIVGSRIGYFNRHILSAFNYIHDFPITFWMMSLFIILYYLPFSSYSSISPLYYQLKYGYYPSVSNTLLSLNSLIGVFISPIIGFLVGVFGIEIFWITLATYLCLIAHGVYAFTFVSPYFLLIMRFIANSMIYCGFWPVIKYVTPPSYMAFGYGILLSVQNFGLSISPMIIASILSNYGYFYLEIAIIICLSAALLVCYAIYRIDQYRTNGVLSLTTQEKCRLLVDRELSIDSDQF